MLAYFSWLKAFWKGDKSNANPGSPVCVPYSVVSDSAYVLEKMTSVWVGEFCRKYRIKQNFRLVYWKARKGPNGYVSFKF